MTSRCGTVITYHGIIFLFTLLQQQLTTAAFVTLIKNPGSYFTTTLPPNVFLHKVNSMTNDVDDNIPTSKVIALNDMDKADVVNECRLLCIADPNDKNNMILYDPNELSENCQVIRSIAANDRNELESLLENIIKDRINTIFVSDPTSRWMLAYVLSGLSKLQQQQHPIVWIHARLAGIDSIMSPELIQWYTEGTTTTNSNNNCSYSKVQMSNARGLFSSTLAEYSIGACTYFSKDFHRLKQNQKLKKWEKYSVSELRGSTLGIIGYGDIGRSTARLAKAYRMKVLALVRQSRSSDEFADEIIVNDPNTNSGMNRIFSESDYVLCALPLTTATQCCIGAVQFALCKPNCVFINVGRGPIVDEDALITALHNKQLKGAALDVFTIEPLPESSPLWEMDNVLLSPHNMDQTDTFLLESTTFFVKEQIPRFVGGMQLLNHVDPTLGY